jgi:hypothetical protein
LIDTCALISIILAFKGKTIKKQESKSEGVRSSKKVFKDEKGKKGTTRVLDNAVYNKEQNHIADITMYLWTQI